VEASDPFAGSTTTAAPPEGAADPFASEGPAGLEPTTADDVAAEVAAEPSEDLPVVDREGQRIDVPDTMTAAGRARAAEGDQPAPETAQEPQEAAQTAEAPQEAPEPQADGDGAGEPPQPPTAAAAPAPDPQPEPAAEKGELRLYKLLYQSGPGQWTEADLSKVAADLKQYIGKDPKDKENKDGLFIKARNNDHARRLAFSIMGRPADGVTVELVARTSWKPVRLAVAPPEPSRERLVIS
jgi:ATP-dependent exoDNAse (exonuclease V) beta subunit